MKKWTMLMALLLTLCVWTAQAQDAPAKLNKAKTATKEKVQTQEKLPAKIPDVQEEARLAREAGIPDEDVKMIMTQARERNLSPEETGAILREGRLARQENGPVDNLGLFVKARLDEGLRGPDLAQAIQQEHKLHGKGQAHLQKMEQKGKAEMKQKGKKEKKSDPGRKK